MVTGPARENGTHFVGSHHQQRRDDIVGARSPGSLLQINRLVVVFELGKRAYVNRIGHRSCKWCSATDRDKILGTVQSCRSAARLYFTTFTMTYSQARSYLLQLPGFGSSGATAYKPGLDRIEKLLDAMGHPERSFVSVHVAGTNGKGSTASMIASIGTALGFRMGLHTSPHLGDLAERMRINGKPAERAWLARTVTRYRHVIEELAPSFFEATVALSFAYFRAVSVDCALVEVGLGGRLDATNILEPEMGIITHVGLDHTDQLGSTIAEIAGEKAGIIKPGMTVIAGKLQQAAVDVVASVAREKGATLLRYGERFAMTGHRGGSDSSNVDVAVGDRRYVDLTVGLAGMHQAENAALAVAAAHHLFERCSDLETGIRTGLRDVVRLSGLRGRLETVQTEPLILADVAHNAEGLKAVFGHLRTLRTNHCSRLVVILGLMRDKPVGAMAAELSSAEVTGVCTVSLDTPRAYTADELSTMLDAYGVKSESAPGVVGAVNRFLACANSDDMLLVTGSHACVAQLQSYET